MSKVTEFISMAVERIDEHSPVILAGLAVAGLITTVVLAIKATPKAIEEIEDAEEEFEEIELEDSAVKRTVRKVGTYVKYTWKIWLPTTIAFVVTLLCIIFSSAISEKRIAALSAAYALSESDRIAYKQAAKEVVGVKEEKKIQKQMDENNLRKSMDGNVPVIYTGLGTTSMYNAIEEFPFLDDIKVIYDAIVTCNNRLNGGFEPYLSLNDFYDEIGLKQSYVGSILGWCAGDTIELDEMSLYLPELSTPQYFVLDFKTRPYAGFRDSLHG